MRQSVASIVALIVIAGLAACNAEEPPMQEPAPEPAPVAAEQPAAEPAVADTEPTEAELPVAEDFEQEAAGAINADNYSTQLAALEKEIGSDTE